MKAAIFVVRFTFGETRFKLDGGEQFKLTRNGSRESNTTRSEDQHDPSQIFLPYHFHEKQTALNNGRKEKPAVQMVLLLLCCRRCGNCDLSCGPSQECKFCYLLITASNRFVR